MIEKTSLSRKSEEEIRIHLIGARLLKNSFLLPFSIRISFSHAVRLCVDYAELIVVLHAGQERVEFFPHLSDFTILLPLRAQSELVPLQLNPSDYDALDSFDPTCSTLLSPSPTPLPSSSAGIDPLMATSSDGHSYSQINITIGANRLFACNDTAYVGQLIDCKAEGDRAVITKLFNLSPFFFSLHLLSSLTHSNTHSLTFLTVTITEGTSLVMPLSSLISPISNSCTCIVLSLFDSLLPPSYPLPSPPFLPSPHHTHFFSSDLFLSDRWV